MTKSQILCGKKKPKAFSSWADCSFESEEGEAGRVDKGDVEEVEPSPVAPVAVEPLVLSEVEVSDTDEMFIGPEVKADEKVHSEASFGLDTPRASKVEGEVDLKDEVDIA